MGALAFPQIDAAIANEEGYGQPGTIATLQNNPGNLIAGSFAAQYGGTAGQNGIATFPTPEAGLAAEDANVQYYANQGATIQDLVNAWAPASVPGNDPTGYANYIQQQTGLNPSTPLSSVNPLTQTGTPAQNNTGLLGSLPSLPNLLNALGPAGTALGGMLGAANSASGTGGGTLFGLSIGRVAAFILGLIFIVAGLFLLKPTQTILERATGPLRAGSVL